MRPLVSRGAATACSLARESQELADAHSVRSRGAAVACSLARESQGFVSTRNPLPLQARAGGDTLPDVHAPHHPDAAPVRGLTNNDIASGQ